jgi:FKBP-type peptidyl-prolyl cis-trans isomerase
MKTLFYLFASLLMLAACGQTYSDEELADFDAEIKSYVEKHDIDCERSSSGLYFRIDSVGSEPLVQFGDQVTFTYTGKFLSGKVFDNNQGKALTLPFRELIGAWKEILLQLGKGGKAYFIAPPSLGYADHELEKIPKNSILIYELEVVDIE